MDGIGDAEEFRLADVRSGGETEALTEEMLGGTVDIGGSVGVDGLPVHRLPKRAGFDCGLIESEAQGLDITCGLAVGHGRAGFACHGGCATDGLFHRIAIRLIFISDVNGGIKGDGAKPEIGVEFRGGILMESQAGDVGEQFGISLLHPPMVVDTAVDNLHLGPTDTRTEVGHSVIVSDFLMLIIRISLAGLRGIPHYASARILVGADESAATAGSDHLVTVERQHSETSECAEHLSVVAGAETFSRILDDGDTILIGHLQDFADFIWHTIEGDRDNGFGRASGFFDTVGDCPFEKDGGNVPRVTFRIDENRCSSDVCDGVG